MVPALKRTAKKIVAMVSKQKNTVPQEILDNINPVSALSHLFGNQSCRSVLPESNRKCVTLSFKKKPTSSCFMLFAELNDAELNMYRSSLWVKPCLGINALLCQSSSGSVGKSIWLEFRRPRFDILAGSQCLFPYLKLWDYVQKHKSFCSQTVDTQKWVGRGSGILHIDLFTLSYTCVHIYRHSLRLAPTTSYIH